MTLCGRCLCRGRRVRLELGHACPDLDRSCPRCRRPLWVTVTALDELGTLSTCAPCGCFVAPNTPPKPRKP
jgi:hypothetical protein